MLEVPVSSSTNYKSAVMGIYSLEILMAFVVEAMKETRMSFQDIYLF